MKKLLFAVPLLLLCLAAVGFSSSAVAGYPSRSISIIVAWPPGGLVDNLVRIVAQKLQPELGQSVVVENKPGAGGVVAANYVGHAQADGYTLLATTSALTMNAALRKKELRFDVLKDFEPIALAGLAPSVLMVRNSLPVKSVKELIALAKSEPGKLTYGSAGIGTPANFSSELLNTMAGIRVMQVPYKGAPPVMLDLAAGRVDMAFANTTVALPQVLAGHVRALAVTSAKRSPLLPDVPTLAEAGLPDFEADQWVGFLAPRGTPRPILERLAKDINVALQDPAVRAALAKQGVVAAGKSSPASFSAYLKKDLAKWDGVVKAAHITVD